MHWNGVWRKWCCGQSVVGPFFLFFFDVQFCESGEKKNGEELTHLTPYLWAAMKRKSLASTHNPICVENGGEENTLNYFYLQIMVWLSPCRLRSDALRWKSWSWVMMMFTVFCWGHTFYSTFVLIVSNLSFTSFKWKLLRYDFWRGLIVGFTFFPSFVALVVHKNPSYVECTRYSRNILLIYVQVL